MYAQREAASYASNPEHIILSRAPWLYICGISSFTPTRDFTEIPTHGIPWVILS